MNPILSRQWVVVGFTIALLYLCGGAPAKDEPPKYEGKTVNEWIETLKTKKPADVQKATVALQKLGRPAVDALAALLRDKDEVIRYYAAYALDMNGAPEAK